MPIAESTATIIAAAMAAAAKGGSEGYAAHQAGKHKLSKGEEKKRYRKSHRLAKAQKELGRKTLKGTLKEEKRKTLGQLLNQSMEREQRAGESKRVTQAELTKAKADLLQNQVANFRAAKQGR